MTRDMACVEVKSERREAKGVNILGKGSSLFSAAVIMKILNTVRACQYNTI